MRWSKRYLAWSVAMVIVAAGPAAPVRGDELISENLPPDRYSSSSVYDNHVPRLRSTVENSSSSPHGSQPTTSAGSRSISAKLATLSASVLLHMRPAGQATYRLWLSDEPMQGEFSSALLVESYPGNHFDGEIMEKVLSQPAPARYVAVETSDSAAWAAWYEIQVFAPDSPFLEVAATCPSGGPIEVEWSRATPEGQCALIFALDEGEFLIPARYPCQGTRLGLGSNQIQLVGTFRSDTQGGRTIRGFAGNGTCGAFLQMLDLTTCDTSNAARIQ